LTRWVLKLSEYEFDIIHNPGKQDINADVLSRHFAADNGTEETEPEVDNQELSLYVIARKQSMYECCTQSRTQAELEPTSKFYVNEQ
jgi:hypothetical protein